ncbi:MULTISPECIES: TetR/AcrR family transcriptional regulator [Halorussus]|uniref:TetR/AcrR family transcriptional regulator n=1 Tax=Halorussus TaxID=1070314 RepID=UPI0020A1A5A9|nr:TetR/AcrR family transcriptional regulator [Halorussus vallis]USZ75847.1 TetR family transcriptional regulator [Halorussus vallis]
MNDDDSFLNDPADTREAIMKATYLALCEHGYAGLTIQRIGDDFEKSKSLLYHHYDSKDELLLDFLEFMLEEFAASVPEIGESRPRDHLEAILDGIVDADLPEERREFRQAMVELRAQAANDERYREQFARHDEFFRGRLEDVVETGIEEGVFRPVDPSRVAAYLMTVVSGAMTQSVTAETDPSEQVREELDRYVEATLLAGDDGE